MMFVQTFITPIIYLGYPNFGLKSKVIFLGEENLKKIFKFQKIAQLLFL